MGAEVPTQRTSKSMGRERPVHAANEHTFREDGSCECGRWNLPMARRHRAAQERAGVFLRSEVPAQATSGKVTLDKIEQNPDLNGER